MATLELAIDATKAQQGAQVAEQAMTRVTKAAEGTGKAVQDAGAKMSAAFQATGGSIQIAGGLAQTAKAFGELNVQAGLFNSSRLLLEIGKTAQDFRELSAGVTGVSGAFGVLSTIIKANPLLAAASAIGAIASAISLFASETKKATDAYEEFGAALQKQRISAQAAAYLGVAGPGPQGSLAAIQGVAERQVLPGAGPMNLQQFGQLGYGATAARYLAQQGTPEQQAAALEYMRTGGRMVSRSYAAGMQGVTVRQFEQGLPSIQLDAAQTQAILRGIYQSIQQEAPTAAAAVGAGVYQFGAEADQPGAVGGYAVREYRPPYFVERGNVQYGMRNITGSMTGMGLADTAMQAAQLGQMALENQRRITELKAEERRYAEQAANYAGQVGSSLGAAFADVLMKTTTLRQAFASIVASFARQGLSEVGAAIFRGAVQGLTPTQSTANSTPPATA